MCTEFTKTNLEVDVGGPLIQLLLQIHLELGTSDAFFYYGFLDFYYVQSIEKNQVFKKEVFFNNNGAY